MTKARYCTVLIIALVTSNSMAVMVAQARKPRHAIAPATQTVPLPLPRPAIDHPPAATTPEASPAKPVETTPPPPSAPAPSPTPSGASGPDCLQRLRDRGVVAEAATPATLPDPRCTVDQPVTLTALASPGMHVDFPDKPVIACSTAETFADFLSQFMVPLAKGSYGQPITAIGTGPGLECRPRNNVAGAKLSAHGQGLAIDIAQFRLGDGRLYKVGSPTDQRDRDFDRAVRAGACGYFHTALGPGADPAHDTHWHMDLEPRGSNGTSRFCQ
ncbi:extensin family protein [Labrys okinawensis]|uniref:extensin family protein n=1 Tax=Labrys okinawensis TaxID=346911 RepID=UPI0039BC3222